MTPAIAIRQPFGPAVLEYALSPEEITVLQLLICDQQDVLLHWEKLWSFVEHYDAFSFACKELMPSAVRRVQEHADPRAWQRLVGSQGSFLSGLPRYTWTKNQYIIRQYQEIAQVLEQAGIPCIALKGACEMLSEGGLSMLRTSRDIDILVREYHAEQCQQLLSGLGWSLAGSYLRRSLLDSPLHAHALTFTHPQGIMELDVHFSAISGPREYAQRFTEHLWSCAVEAPGYPGIRLPSRAHRLVITAANAYNLYKWGKGQFSKYLYDAYLLSVTMDQAAIAQVVDMARQYLDDPPPIEQLLSECQAIRNGEEAVATRLHPRLWHFSLSHSGYLSILIMNDVARLGSRLLMGPGRWSTFLFFVSRVLYNLFVRIPRALRSMFQQTDPGHVAVQSRGKPFKLYLFSKP